jgi:oxygen-independent coproporphyrinogen-3 oxidase
MFHASSSTHAAKSADEDALALYIHWPFCIAKCPYCDFNSHVRDQIDHDAWRTALLLDLRHEYKVNGNKQISSVFFGGGTPSLMDPRLVAKLVEEADILWGLTDHCEITLEANPSSVEANRFADLSHAGVNRVSLGLQSLDDETLKFLGRAHDVAEGLSALDTAQQNFDRVSFDLIYARPGQSLRDWQSELEKSLGFGTDHLSLYQLTIEPGTRFETLVRTGKLVPADDDHCADMFELTQELGLPAYEISNHARQGQESRHNLTYWRYEDYVGVGPGAHGRRLNSATERHKKPENFLSAVQRNGNGLKFEQSLSPEVRATEALMMGLRLAEGVNLTALEKKTNLVTDQMIDLHQVEKLTALGLLEPSADRLMVTARGMPLLDAILPKVIADSLRT